MTFWPYGRNPITDMTGGLVMHSNGEGRCAAFEMKMMNCLEAYGEERGAEKCDLIIQDFQECVGMKKQNDRLIAMRFERHRQYLTGERSKENHYAKTPKHDSY